jgi:hypothetical protein
MTSQEFNPKRLWYTQECLQIMTTNKVLVVGIKIIEEKCFPAELKNTNLS